MNKIRAKPSPVICWKCPSSRLLTSRFQLVLLVSLLAAQFGTAQPGEIVSYAFSISSGSVAIPSYTPFAVSYYPFYNGLPDDSVKHVLHTQLVPGSVAEADRVINANNGAYAYRDESGNWSGTLNRMVNGKAYLIANRHEARELVLEGVPADSFTYISPMPAGGFRTAAARMLCDHRLDSVGFTYSGFHWSENMRRGGDIVIDMVTRQIARRDSTDGWIGTMTHLRIGQPIIVQVNHPLTFDWHYVPGEE